MVFELRHAAPCLMRPDLFCSRAPGRTRSALHLNSDSPCASTFNASLARESNLPPAIVWPTFTVHSSTCSMIRFCPRTRKRVTCVSRATRLSTRYIKARRIVLFGICSRGVSPQILRSQTFTFQMMTLYALHRFQEISVDISSTIFDHLPFLHQPGKSHG